MAYLALSVTRVMHRVRIETFKLVWREEDAPLMAFDLCKEVLLLVVMRWCNIACRRRLGTENAITNECPHATYQTTVLKPDPLPSMPMSSRLDVSCPQFLWACCLLIQFQLKPRKSRTIFLPTVSFRVCCKYTLWIQKKIRCSKNMKGLVPYWETWKKL